MRKMKKKVMTALLIVFVAGLLSACGGSKIKEVTNKGRYMEQEIELPKGEQVVGLLQNEKHQFELFTNKRKGEQVDYKKYVLNAEGKWEEKKSTWLSKIWNTYLKESGLEGEVAKLILGEDGTYYALISAYGENNSRKFLFSSSDGETGCQQVEIPYLNKEETDDTGYISGPWISDIDALSNGTLILNDVREGCFLLFSKKGENIGKLNIKGQNFSMGEGNGTDVIGNEVIGITPNGKEILIIDGESQTEKKTVKLEHNETGAVVSKLSDGTIVLVDEKGIYQQAENGSLWELILDGERNTMGAANMEIRSVFVEEGETDAYTILYRNENGEFSLIHYQFDEAINSVPEKELTVYSLKENSTVRQAVSLFQRKNPDVKINYVVAMKEEERDSSQYIKALNTELIAGKGADVLVLDSLPVDSYIEKGVLKDIKEIGKEEEVLPNILKAYQVGEAVYQIPTKISVPIIIGKKEVVESANSLANLATYQRNHSDKSLVKDSFYRSMAKEFLKMEVSSFIREDNTVDMALFKTYLTDISYLKEKGCFTTMDEGMEESADFGIYSNPYFFMKKKANATWQLIESMDNLFVLQTLNKEQMYEFGSIEDSFLARGCIGINQATKKEALAKEFVSFILSDKVQAEEVYDGLPVSEPVLRTLVETDKDLTYGVSYQLEDGSSGDLDGEYPNQETRESFAKLIKTLSHPITKENELVNLIMEEIDPYLKSGKGLEQILSSVESKVNTYLAEQKTK